MIKEYCDGCNVEIPHGDNKVANPIKACMKVGLNYISVEVKLGALSSDEEKGNRISIWQGLGHLCKICAVRAVLFAADGCAMGRLDHYCAEKPVMAPVPKWIDATVVAKEDQE